MICSGQTVSDADSPIDGEVLPDLNGERRFLRGGNVAGAMEDDQIGEHRHSYNDYYYSDTGDDNNFSTPTGDDVGQRLQAARTTGAAGGSETRPINMTVTWIIRIK